MHSPVLPFPMGRCGPIGKCTQGSNVSSTSLRPIHQLVEQEKVVAPVPKHPSRPKEGEWKLKPKEGYVSHVRACARPHGHEGVTCAVTYQTLAHRTARLNPRSRGSSQDALFPALQHSLPPEWYIPPLYRAGCQHRFRAHRPNA